MLYYNPNYKKAIFKITAITKDRIVCECIHYEKRTQYYTSLQHYITMHSCTIGMVDKFNVKEIPKACNDLFYDTDGDGVERSCHFSLILNETDLKELKDNYKKWAILNTQSNNIYVKELAKLILEDRIIYIAI